MSGSCGSGFFETVCVLSEKFRGINWMIINGASLLFHGVCTFVNDIDILTDREGARRISLLLEDYCVREIEFCVEGIFKSYFGVYELNGFKVEIIANFEVFVDNEWKDDLYCLDRKVVVNKGGVFVPVVSLEDVFLWYMRVRREKDVEKINLILKSYLSKVEGGVFSV